eukprot:30927-Pelagococcus_subviridis.AAC.10
MYIAARSIKIPCPKSPNITANKNGNVTMVSTVGFTSLYRAIPYASTMPWNAAVTLFVRKYVGGSSFDASGWKIVPTSALEDRFARSSASRTAGFANVGHHASATTTSRATSTENMFNAWYVAFCFLTNVVHAACARAMPRRRSSRCAVDARNVCCRSVSRAATSARIRRRREKSS